MRILVITLIVLVAVIAGILAIAPRFVDWNDYRDLLTRQAEAITGGEVAIEGHIGLRLLPAPTLTLGRTTLVGRAHTSGTLTADRIDLRLRALPLLRGQVRVAEIRLVRPHLQWDYGAAAPPATGGGNPILSLIALAPDRLALIDGHAQLRDATGRGWQIDAIDLEASGDSQDGPFTLRGGFTVDARPFEIDAKTGRLGGDRVGSLQLVLSVLGPARADLRYSGAVWWDPENPRARGDLELAGEDAAAAIAMIADAAGEAGAATASWPVGPFAITGAVQLERERLVVDDLALSLAGAAAQGELALTLGAEPSIALALRAERIAWAADPGAGIADLAPIVTLASRLRGTIDLSAGSLPGGSHSIDRVRASLRLDGGGGVVIEQASAILPGQTDVRFEGGLESAGDGLVLRGDLGAVTDDLAGLLTWLGIEPPAVAGGRLRTLSLAAAVVADRDAWRATDAELRVDATQVRGSAELTRSARPRLSAELTLDRLNIDAYTADWRPADLVAGLQEVLRGADAELSARTERLTWHGLLMRDAAVALRAEDGRVVVTNASLEVADEAAARLDGNIDLDSGVFTWSAELHTRQLVRLLRHLGVAAPLTLTRSPPLDVRLEAVGRAERFEVEAAVEDGAGRLTARGEAGWREGGARYDLEVALSHPDFSTLVRPLGARTAIGEDAAPVALSFTGKLVGTEFQNTVAGSARLGDMSLTGLLAWRDEEGRPRYDLQVSLAEPTAPMLAALLELVGLSPPVGLLDGPLLGNLPRFPLGLGWLARFDGSLKLTAKGGLAGEGTELDARLQDAVLFVDRAAARYRHGRLSLELTVDAARPLPFLTASLDLRAVDAAWLAAKLDLAPVIQGSVDLSAEATAAGSSVYDLVRGLIGRIELEMAEGKLLGSEIAPIAQALGEEGPIHETPALPFTDLDGRFALERGLASAESMTIEFDRADARVMGVADLLLWAGDLTLEIEAPDDPDTPIALRIVGPLRRPQTLLELPEQPATAEP